MYDSKDKGSSTPSQSHLSVSTLDTSPKADSSEAKPSLSPRVERELLLRWPRDCAGKL